ncbi:MULTISPECIES: glycerol-3-phosphate dehydrogenase/oxidase [Asticcacaulis]|uniref:glycerol-3-phosphate dehydrogenase/oxidase n=1 Tax=Asticcacaulis TaxID=76890 RepID=UPI001AE5D3DC|nr:glycerol-3-phosphate dehydrogenase/oxidase [Asticcacaulis sp. BE141]MBP2159295.1 glycerol-3-phosphate dehydrogenase [Asticcacaulis solisilvae]MDR6800340.1 glycerol-3-phosphate dehydrogenase [Asticcacaulis sp. BE141]
MNDPRSEILAAATADRVWDVVVIGGGASGLATALEAATRGASTLLLEAHDYAKGTSSRSTKLVHGGVRYLAQGNVRLVMESLHERGVLKRNAPHLVRDLGFLVAAYQAWRLPFYATGLKLYDLLAGTLNLRSSRILDRKAALAHMSTLKPDGLLGGVLYFDAQFDDSRLAITLMRSFEDAGGVALNAAPVTQLIKTDGRVTGVQFSDAETGQTYAVRARVVINATGIFADTVRHLDDANAAPLLSPSQGVHIVVGREFLPGDAALMVPRTEDGRVLFAVPWHGRTLIGTTDTAMSDIALEPRPLHQEIDFILRTAAAYLRPAPTRSDVLSVFAGLRPLVRDPNAKDSKTLARDHVIVVSDSGLVTLTGGKWTTCRRMGQDVVDRAAKGAGLTLMPSRTEHLHMHGWTTTADDDHWRAYGADASRIRALPGAAALLHPGLPYVEAEVYWAVRHEQARTVEDVLARRLRMLFLDANAAINAAPRVAELMAVELGRDPAWQAGQVQAFTELAQFYQL